MSCLKISWRFYMLLLWEMRSRIWYLRNGTNMRWIQSFGLYIYVFFPNWWNFTCSSMQQPCPQDFLNSQAVYSSSAILPIEVNTSYEISKLTWIFSIPFHVFPFISVNLLGKNLLDTLLEACCSFIAVMLRTPKPGCSPDGVLRADQEWRGSRNGVKPWMQLSCLCGHRYPMIQTRCLRYFYFQWSKMSPVTLVLVVPLVWERSFNWSGFLIHTFLIPVEVLVLTRLSKRKIQNWAAHKTPPWWAAAVLHKTRQHW